MDAVNLIRSAEAAGLTLEVRADQLIVRGPKIAEPLVRQLAEHKPMVLRALKPDWAKSARRLIATCPDQGLRSDLLDAFDEAAASLEYGQKLAQSDAEQQAFGLLLFNLLRLGVDARAS